MSSKFHDKTVFISALFLVLTALALSSCGYRMVGSKFLSFKSVTIKSVTNKTYEPRLEERLHNALSREFINQGIEVKKKGAEVEIDVTVDKFQLGAVGAVDEIIKEQELIMEAFINVIDQQDVYTFRAMKSPIKITFQSTGSVSEAAANKDIATDKACSEIAKEIVGQLIVRYAK